MLDSKYSLLQGPLRYRIFFFHYTVLNAYLECGVEELELSSTSEPDFPDFVTEDISSFILGS